LGFARMGALHGLDPYTHLPAEAPSDAAFPFIGWPFKHSPYGPLFTLGSYTLAPVSLGAALWALKALALTSSLAATALVARAAGFPLAAPATRAGPAALGVGGGRRAGRARGACAGGLRRSRAGLSGRRRRAAAARRDAQHPRRDGAPRRPVGGTGLVAAPVRS